MRFCLALVQLPHQRSRPLRQFQEEDRIQAMGKGPQGLHPVAPSLCSFAGPSWRFRLGPQEMNLSAATLLSQSVETLPPPIPTCHSHDCKLADPRKLPGPSTSQRWDCLPSNQAHQLDKIKNFRIKVQVSPVGVALTGLAAYPCGAPMRRAAGQSSQRRGFYSEDLKSDMRLPAMS